MLQTIAVSSPRADAVLLESQDKSPSEFQSLRDAAVDWVAQDKVSQAHELVSRALRESPDSQELLALLALICEVQHDWPAAASCLEQLVRIQGEQATAEALSHWVRVLRCQGLLDQALGVAARSLTVYPDHRLLNSELQTLSSMLAAKHQSGGV